MLLHTAWRDGENPPPNVEFSVVHTRRHPAAVKSVAYSPDDTLLGVANGSNICVYEAASTRSLSRDLVGRMSLTSTTDSSIIQSLTFATIPDQYRISNDISDGVGGILTEGNGPDHSDDHDFLRDSFTQCAFSNQGLLTATSDGKVLLWNVRDGRTLATLLQVEAPVCSVATNDSTRLFVSGAADGRIHIRSLRCDSLRGPTMQAPGGNGFTAVAFSPTGSIVTSGDCQGIAAAWDVESGRRMWTNDIHSPRRPRDLHPALLTIAFSPDGRLLLTGAHDGSVCLHDLANYEEPVIRTFAAHPSTVHAISFAPNGRWFISACADGIIRLWDPRFTSRVVETHVSGQRSPLLTVAHASFSKTFCSGDTDGTAYACSYI